MAMKRRRQRPAKDGRAKKSKQDSTSQEADPDTSFPLMKLPRELRNRVYELHLESIYYKSRALDPFYDGSTEHLWDHTPRHEDWGTKQGDVIYRGYYQPVYQERRASHTDLVPWYAPNWQAREYPVPELLKLQGSRLSREARECYIERKLLVDIDSINRFQTWCLDLPPTSLKSIQRLYIATRARYMPPAEYGHFFRVTGQITGDQPMFLIKTLNAGRELVVTSRCQLAENDLAVLRSNLRTLITPLLAQGKTSFDGEDIVEAMFAFHCKSVWKRRSDLVVGAMKKGLIDWTFVLHPSDVVRAEATGVEPEELVKEVLDYGNAAKHILFRVKHDEGVIEY